LELNLKDMTYDIVLYPLRHNTTDNRI